MLKLTYEEGIITYNLEIRTDDISSDDVTEVVRDWLAAVDANKEQFFTPPQEEVDDYERDFTVNPETQEMVDVVNKPIPDLPPTALQELGGCDGDGECCGGEGCKSDAV
jgi:DNA polymerase elongation subunit (family B)